jgi:hypothetical protein
MPRRTAPWMQQLDERILEWLTEEGWATPGIMASRPEFRWASEARIRERVEMLVYAEFVAPIAEEMVEITTWGQQYLDGEIDAVHHPYPTKAKSYS